MLRAACGWRDVATLAPGCVTDKDSAVNGKRTNDASRVTSVAHPRRGYRAGFSRYRRMIAGPFSDAVRWGGSSTR